VLYHSGVEDLSGLNSLVVSLSDIFLQVLVLFDTLLLLSKLGLLRVK
jgi:hypothetical protein